MTSLEKEQYKQRIKQNLCSENEINKIIIFGSFVSSQTPMDIDVAIFQDSQDNYLTLSMKYRKLTRDISREIPLDIIPIRKNANPDSFLQEIEAGEIIYEK